MGGGSREPGDSNFSFFFFFFSTPRHCLFNESMIQHSNIARTSLQVFTLYNNKNEYIYIYRGIIVYIIYQFSVIIINALSHCGNLKCCVWHTFREVLYLKIEFIVRSIRIFQQIVQNKEVIKLFFRPANKIIL